MSLRRQTHRCLRCDYAWLGREAFKNNVGLPKRCARCRSPLWNTPKIKAGQVDVGATLEKWFRMNLRVSLMLHQRYRYTQGDHHVTLDIRYGMNFVAGSWSSTIEQCIAECVPAVEKWAAEMRKSEIQNSQKS